MARSSGTRVPMTFGASLDATTGEKERKRARMRERQRGRIVAVDPAKKGGKGGESVTRRNETTVRRRPRIYGGEKHESIQKDV